MRKKGKTDDSFSFDKRSVLETWKNFAMPLPTSIDQQENFQLSSRFLVYTQPCNYSITSLAIRWREVLNAILYDFDDQISKRNK